MQKLRIEVIDKLINQKATNRELNFLIYISRYQDDTGNVIGVHYRDVCDYFKKFTTAHKKEESKLLKLLLKLSNKENPDFIKIEELKQQLEELKQTRPADFSIQTFYDVKKSLEEKGIVKVSKNNGYDDYNIQILDNDCSDIEKIEDGEIQYINTNHRIFYSRPFFAMKAGEKLLAMEFFRLTRSGNGSHTVDIKGFYKKYTELLGLKLRALQNYLHTLKKYFRITLKNKNYRISAHEWITRSLGNATEAKNYREHIGYTACRRIGLTQKIKKKLPVGQNHLTRDRITQDSNFIATVNLITQFANKYSNIATAFLDAVHRSIHAANKAVHKKRDWDIQLQPKLINKILSGTL